MYINPAFQFDRTASLAFAAEHAFGLVVACGADRPVASPLPFHLDYAADGTPRVGFHVARVNPLARLAAAGGGAWLLSVVGHDAYVSPDWYASPDQVPTWLYESVQLAGPVEIMSNTELTRHLDLFAERFEAWLAPKQPWTADKVTPARYKMLAKAIVGITMTVETVEGSLKLNQHKSDADHVAIAQALSARPDAASRALAAQMAAMRPHLTYAAADAIPSPVAANLDQVLPGAAGA